MPAYLSTGWTPIRGKVLNVSIDAVGIGRQDNRFGLAPWQALVWFPCAERTFCINPNTWQTRYQNYLECSEGVQICAVSFVRV